MSLIIGQDDSYVQLVSLYWMYWYLSYSSLTHWTVSLRYSNKR
jgi:hypothetical protein